MGSNKNGCEKPAVKKAMLSNLGDKVSPDSACTSHYTHNGVGAPRWVK
jgi:hypothetical protein